jgi:PIN domain nuclease of toxin-antitoxin system
VSTGNIAEVASRLFAFGMPEDAAETIIDTLQLSIQPYDYGQAMAAAKLRAITGSPGLWLGDRACLCLAKTRQTKVLTVDQAWQDIAGSAGVAVTLIRSGRA